MRQTSLPYVNLVIGDWGGKWASRDHWLMSSLLFNKISNRSLSFCCRLFLRTSESSIQRTISCKYDTMKPKLTNGFIIHREGWATSVEKTKLLGLNHLTIPVSSITIYLTVRCNIKCYMDIFKVLLKSFHWLDQIWRMNSSTLASRNLQTSRNTRYLNKAVTMSRLPLNVVSKVVYGPK